MTQGFLRVSLLILVGLASGWSACAHPAAHMNYAANHFRAERYRQALARYQQVVREFPRSREAPHAQLMVGVCYGWLAGALRDRSLLQKEAAAYRQLIRDYPKSGRLAEAYLYLGQIHSGHVPVPGTTVDCARAIPLFRKAMAASQRTWIKAQALGRMGQCYARQGKKSRALASYREVIRRYPKTPWATEVRLLVGTVLFSQKRYGAALPMILSYRALRKESRAAPLALLMLGLTYGWLAAQRQQTDLLQKSSQAYLTLIRRHPRTVQVADALLYLGQTYAGHTGVRGASRDCKKAVPILRRAMAKTTRAWIKAQALGRIGQCQARAGDKAAARTTYRTVFESYPHTPWAKIAKQLHDALGAKAP